MKIFVVRNIANEILGYFLKNTDAHIAANNESKRYGEKWFVIEVEVKE